MPNSEVRNLLKFQHVMARVDEIKGSRPRDARRLYRNVETGK
jgi:hypothetical protein